MVKIGPGGMTQEKPKVIHCKRCNSKTLNETYCDRCADKLQEYQALSADLKRDHIRRKGGT